MGAASGLRWLRVPSSEFRVRVPSCTVGRASSRAMIPELGELARRQPRRTKQLWPRKSELGTGQLRNPHRQPAVHREGFAGDVIVLHQFGDDGRDLLRGAFAMKRDALLEVQLAL